MSESNEPFWAGDKPTGEQPTLVYPPHLPPDYRPPRHAPKTLAVGGLRRCARCITGAVLAHLVVGWVQYRTRRDKRAPHWDNCSLQLICVHGATL